MHYLRPVYLVSGVTQPQINEAELNRRPPALTVLLLIRLALDETALTS